jgi:transposase
MQIINTVGIDLAKSTLRPHGVDANGRTVLRKAASRSSGTMSLFSCQICRHVFWAWRPAPLPGYWARIIESCGHTVRRIQPKFVKPDLMSDEKDANDAAAICETVQRAHMRISVSRWVSGHKHLFDQQREERQQPILYMTLSILSIDSPEV